MSARAMWKAEIAIGTHKVPVKLYAAIDEKKVRFRLLDESSKAPVQQQMIDASTEEPIGEGTAQKGIQIDEGRFVVVTPEELASLEPEDSRTITIERFVSPSAVGEAWYDRPYWLGPDGDENAYFALVQALALEEKIGIAHWAMRKHRYHGALRVSGEHLMLVKMRSAEEVVPTASLEAPTGRAADPKEIALAEQLVAALEGPFDPNELEGTYDDRVRELIEAKAKGKKVAKKRATVAKPTKDTGLAAALKASLAKVGGSASSSKADKSGGKRAA